MKSTRANWKLLRTLVTAACSLVICSVIQSFLVSAWIVVHTVHVLHRAVLHPGYAVAVGIAADAIGDEMNAVILTTEVERPKLADYLFLGSDCVAPSSGSACLPCVLWSRCRVP